MLVKLGELKRSDRRQDCGKLDMKKTEEKKGRNNIVDSTCLKP